MKKNRNQRTSTLPLSQKLVTPVGEQPNYSSREHRPPRQVRRQSGVVC
jgi:hypothetical protein